MTNTLTLKDVAEDILQRHGVSGRELQEVARDRGLKLAYTTVNHMAAGTYTSKPTMETLNALAALSGFTVEQVYAAARRPAPRKPFRDRVPSGADALSDEQVDVVLGVIREFVKANDQIAAKESGDAQDEAPNTRAPGSGVPKAKRGRKATPTGRTRR